MEKNKDTAFVLNELNNASSLSQGLKVIDDEELFTQKSFSTFFNEYLSEHQEKKLSKIIDDSGLTRTYAYDVINGKKKASRDRILALCFAAKMNQDETNHALNYAGYNKLYPKDCRDAHLILAFNRLQQKTSEIKTVTDLNLFLMDRDQDPLDV